MIHSIQQEVQMGALQAARIVNRAIPRFVTRCMSTHSSLASREVARTVRRTGEWDKINFHPRTRKPAPPS